MKILRLDLRAYGPFTGDALDFPGDGPGFHLIHGPNEAGKSSTLRALRRLLFGFPHNVGDDFRHEAKRQRVGATIEGGDGSKLVFLRRRGKAKTLRAADDETVVDDAALDRYLGGIDGERFKTLYSTDLAELVEGGRGITAGGGDVGSILFGGAGLARMPRVLRDLRAEADKLYKPRASTPAINASLAGLKTTRGEIARAQLSSDLWLKARDACDDAARRRDASKAERDSLDTERNRLTRLGQALPLLGRRRALRAELDALGPVTILPDDFADRYLTASTLRKAAIKTVEICRAAIADLESRLATIAVPDRLLAEADAIGTLRESLGAHRKGREDRTALNRKIERETREATELLRLVAPERSLAEVESLALTKAQKLAIKKRTSERLEIQNDETEARDTLTNLEARFAAHPLAVDFHEARTTLDELAASITRINGLGDLDAVEKEARAKLRKLETRVKSELARLSLWTGTLDDLAAARVPPIETISRFEGLFTEARKQIEAVETDRKSIADQIDAIDRDLDDDRIHGALPDEADLDEARGDRDRDWARIRRAWLDRQPVDAPIDLAAAYEREVLTADARADLLRRAADRVARRAGYAADRARLATKAEAIPVAIERAAVGLARVESEWVAVWRPAGIDPRSPAEMRGWMTSYHALMNQVEPLADARAEAGRAAERRDEAIAELEAVLKALGEPKPAAAESLAVWKARAEAVKARGDLGDKLAEARTEARSAAERLGHWRDAWARAVAPLGLPPEASTTDADDALERVDALLKSANDLKTLQDEASRIDGEAARFERQVREVARRVDAIPGEESPEALLETLRMALDHGQKAFRDRESSDKALATQRDQLRTAEATVTKQTTEIEELCRLAGRDTADALPTALAASSQARALRLALANEESHLANLAGGGSLDALASEAEGLDPDTLPARLRDLNDEIKRLESQVETQNVELGQLRQTLQTMNGGATAANANEQARQWLSAIEGDVEHYARLRLAEAVLRRAIDVYRERNQGPILGRTSTLFAELTVGSFAGVKLDDGLDEDERRPDDKPVLKGLRLAPTRELVPVEGMSEGTANALFLAVRLATLETYLDPREPLPFIIDDILVHFDDQRAAAALRVLARLAEKTQVLFFTHHEHLVSLASETLRPGDWRRHRLPDRAG